MDLFTLEDIVYRVRIRVSHHAEVDKKIPSLVGLEKDGSCTHRKMESLVG